MIDVYCIKDAKRFNWKAFVSNEKRKIDTGLYKQTILQDRYQSTSKLFHKTSTCMMSLSSSRKKT